MNKKKYPRPEIPPPPSKVSQDDLREVYLNRHLPNAGARGFFVLPGWVIDKVELCWVAHERAFVTEVPDHGHLMVWIKPRSHKPGGGRK